MNKHEKSYKGAISPIYSEDLHVQFFFLHKNWCGAWQVSTYYTVKMCTHTKT